MGIELFHMHGAHAHLIVSAVTNGDGRVDGPLLDGDDFAPGEYELVFNVGAYFSKQGLEEASFLELVPVRFLIADAEAHYHVPLLVSPFGYSTYRGS